MFEALFCSFKNFPSGTVGSKFMCFFIIPTSIYLFIELKVFLFCFSCLRFITSAFHPYANAGGLTKRPMSAIEDRGRLGVAAERVFHFDVNQWGRRGEKEREECF